MYVNFLMLTVRFKFVTNYKKKCSVKNLGSDDENYDVVYNNGNLLEDIFVRFFQRQVVIFQFHV